MSATRSRTGKGSDATRRQAQTGSAPRLVPPGPALSEPTAAQRLGKACALPGPACGLRGSLAAVCPIWPWPATAGRAVWGRQTCPGPNRIGRQLRPAPAACKTSANRPSANPTARCPEGGDGDLSAGFGTKRLKSKGIRAELRLFSLNPGEMATAKPSTAAAASKTALHHRDAIRAIGAPTVPTAPTPRRGLTCSGRRSPPRPAFTLSTPDLADPRVASPGVTRRPARWRGAARR